MSIRNKGLVFAMEEAELEAAPAEVVPAAELEVEQGVGEVVENAGEVDELATAVEEAVEDVESLTDIQDVMAGSVEGGEGLSEDAAEIAEVAVEAICARLGIRGKSNIPALESFGSKNSRVAATRIAIENIGDTIKRVWEAIKKTFLTIIQKVKDFFFNFFNNIEKIEKLAKELKSKVDALDSQAKAKEDNIKSSGIASSVTDGKDANYTTAVKMLDMHTRFSNSFKAGVNMFAGVSAAVFSNAKQLTDAKNSDKAVNNIKAELKNIEKAFSVGGLTTDYSGKLPEGVTAEFKSQTNALVNGDTFVTIVGTKNDKPFVQLTVEKNSEFKKDSVPVLARNEMKELCDGVVSLCKPTAEMKKEQSNIEKVGKELVATTDAIIKMANTINNETTDSAEIKKNIESVKNIVLGVNNGSTTFATYLPTANARACKAVCNYVSASLKAYSVEEKKKED
jgi:hypothetical protein